MERLAAVSNAVVAIFSECYGRGPTKAKSYAFDNFVVTVLEDLLTTVERTLVNNGEQDLVRRVRLTFQEIVADRFKDAVAEAMGRPVAHLPQPGDLRPAHGLRDLRARAARTRTRRAASALVRKRRQRHVRRPGEHRGEDHQG